MDMDLGDAIRTVNWQAKNLSAARFILAVIRKNGDDDSWVPDISATDARCIDQIAQEYGIRLRLAENLSKYTKSCDLDVKEENCPLHEMKYANMPIHKTWFRRMYCSDCSHFKEGVKYTYQKPDIENIDFAIEKLTKNIDFLYGLKERACVESGEPIISYQRNSAGHVYRVYDIDGYKPHCPADDFEISQITDGEIRVSNNVLHKKDPLSIYQLDFPVEEAVKFIEDYERRKNGKIGRRKDP